MDERVDCDYVIGGRRLPRREPPLHPRTLREVEKVYPWLAGDAVAQARVARAHLLNNERGFCASATLAGAVALLPSRCR